MVILTLLVVGLIAGALAALVVGGYGLLGDILIGVAGAYLGSYLVARYHWHAPVAGFAGTVMIAFGGALILLVLLHLVHAAMYGFSRPRYWRRRDLP
jgi:uncharacterized membrane protein YeaQ/YmgE (transglycosylase-associated protein family)